MTFTNDEILTLTMLEIFEISAFHFVLSSVCVSLFEHVETKAAFCCDYC